MRNGLYSCASTVKNFYALPDGATIEYEVSNRGFSDFLSTYYCDFLRVCTVYTYGREVCVLLWQWLIGPAGIAVPRNRQYAFDF